MSARGFASPRAGGGRPSARRRAERQPFDAGHGRGAPRALRILISAGPTREPIDPVRFLSNYSTGYMGARLATEALSRGHRVTVVRGPSLEPMPPAARVLPVERAEEMEQTLRRQAPAADVVIMAAAVADFRPLGPTATKLPRRPRQILRLQATPDIIARLPRRTGQLIAGFAIESGQVIPRARRKLQAKRLDLLLAQRTNSSSSPFGRHKVHAWLLARGSAPQQLGYLSKSQVARALLDKVETLWYGQPRTTRLQKAL